MSKRIVLSVGLFVHIFLMAAMVHAAEPTPPNWIWTAAEGKSNEKAFFRRAFDSGIANAGGVRSVILWGTCDNEMTVYLNGQQVARSTTWQQPVRVDVKKSIVPGRNVLAVACQNDDSTAAGLILRLSVILDTGRRVDLISDESWHFSADAPNGWQGKNFDDAAWKAAHVIGKLGVEPWGNFPGADGKPPQATPAEQLTVLPGFKAELLYSVPKETEDSWVCMTTDSKGRLIASGQDGPLFRITPGKDAASTKVERLNVPIGHAQGLLWAFDSLYVTVNGRGIGGHGSGFYRLRDTKGNDQFDEVTLLKAFKDHGGRMAGGEHGPHAIRLGPDNKLYVIAGNFTGLPDGVAANSPHHGFQEDQLLPRNPDGNGFATGLMAPGGWICRTDADGKNWEVFCAGFRNPYDMDFNLDGELFVFDADMEWDTGTPWYRPTRVNLATSGAEFGWRYGTGKWPDFYADSLGAVANVGLGSPTGVGFGTGAKFPAKYQRAIYLNDWAYGRMYAMHMTPVGAGYKATFEPFVFGKPFSVTDLVINKDGAMYVTIGGRGTQSGLYRITYVGNESTAPVGAVQDSAAAEARAIRHKLESFHGKQDPTAVSFAWDYLNSTDRYLRYAARIAIEWQDVAQWQERALAERRPTALINAMVALSRVGDKSLQSKVLERLDQLTPKTLSEEQTLESLRALSLCFIRMGKPDENTAAEIVSRLDPLFPAQSNFVNRELCQMLTYLESPTVVGKAMTLLSNARTQEDQLHYAFVLRNASKGWTLDQRKAYFSWLNLASQKYNGGASFKNFLKKIREDAILTLSADEKTTLADVISGAANVQVVKETKPRQFVQNWQMQDLLPEIDKATKGRSFERGQAVFEAVQCAQCHRFNTQGGSTGPDLTGVGNRFSPADVLESILLPSKVISDQYRATEFITKDHDVVVGTVESEDGEKIVVRTHPLSPETVPVMKSNVTIRRPSAVSMMPEGLVDVLSKDEILDLIAYLRSAGDAKDKAFGR